MDNVEKEVQRLLEADDLAEEVKINILSFYFFILFLFLFLFKILFLFFLNFFLRVEEGDNEDLSNLERELGDMMEGEGEFEDTGSVISPTQSGHMSEEELISRIEVEISFFLSCFLALINILF